MTPPPPPPSPPPPGWWQARDGKWYPPQLPLPPKKKGWFGRLSTAWQVGLILGAIILVGALIAIGSASEDEADDHSSLACNHFRNVVGDVQRGLLTGPELRSKLQEIYDDASIATPAVQQAAQAMLRIATTGGAGAETAISDMDSACTAAGY